MREDLLQLFKAINRLQFRTKRQQLGSKLGSHRSVRKGHGIEFADYREYQPGDSPRDIDWYVTARKEQTYVKTYKEESNLSLLLLLDTSKSLVVGVKECFFQATAVTLGLAYIGILNKESVYVSAPGVTPIRYLRSNTELEWFSKNLYSEFEGVNQSEVIAKWQVALAKVRYPGVVVIVSDLLFDLNELELIIAAAKGAGLDVYIAALEIEVNLEIFSGHLVDLEDQSELELNGDPRQLLKMYREKHQEHFRSVEQLAAKYSGKFIQIKSSDTGIEIFSDKLHRVGLFV